MLATEPCAPGRQPVILSKPERLVRSAYDVDDVALGRSEESPVTQAARDERRRCFAAAQHDG